MSLFQTEFDESNDLCRPDDMTPEVWCRACSFSYIRVSSIHPTHRLGEADPSDNRHCLDTLALNMGHCNAKIRKGDAVEAVFKIF